MRYSHSSRALGLAGVPQLIFDSLGPFGEFLGRRFVLAEVLDGDEGLEAAVHCEKGLTGVHEGEVEGGCLHCGCVSFGPAKDEVVLCCEEIYM